MLCCLGFLPVAHEYQHLMCNTTTGRRRRRRRHRSRSRDRCRRVSFHSGSLFVASKSSCRQRSAMSCCSASRGRELRIVRVRIHATVFLAGMSSSRIMPAQFRGRLLCCKCCLHWSLHVDSRQLGCRSNFVCKLQAACQAAFVNNISCEALALSAKPPAKDQPHA